MFWFLVFLLGLGSAEALTGAAERDCPLVASHLPALLIALPVDGETWRRRGSMKGVKDEEDLCFGTVGVCENTTSKE